MNGFRPGQLCLIVDDNAERILVAIDAGAQDFIMKPFDAEILLGKIDDVARLHAAPDATA